MLRTAFIATVVLAAAGAAHAETQRPAGSVAIKARDLATPEGAQAFYRDLQHAAADVCGGQRTAGGITNIDVYDRCYAATLKQAVAKADAPLVTALLASSGDVRLASR